jgi:predicted ATPase/class 3 adenylate cyclase
METERRTRTILFADTVASTELRTSLGDDAADVVRRELDRILRRSVDDHQGLFAKGTGDGMMAVFVSAADAVECAVDLQERMDAYRRRNEQPVEIRIGLSAGDVVQEDDDWFGTPVVEAARLEGAAESSQILAAEIVRLLAGTRTTRRFGPTRDLELKGLAGPLRACALHWQDDATADPEPPPSAPQPIDLRPEGPHFRAVPLGGPDLVGREHDLAEVERCLEGPHRVVTLTGPGGVGKTRLAFAAAEDAVAGGRFPDGVHVVELAPFGPEQVVNAVASSLDVREGPGLDLASSLVVDLAERSVLVVLDNCEHVANAAAHLVYALVSGAPGLVVLATSQVPLGLAQEVVYEVDPLGVPGEGVTDPDQVTAAAAAQLFVDRARQANRSFRLTDDSAEAVAQICRRLDGIPLAVELAAARVRALSPSQIAARLDDRFHLLTTGLRTDDERHQTLQAAVDWSYSLLSEPEARVLARVSMFPGGFDLETAERVVSDDDPDGVRRDDVLDLVATLVDKSLVTTVDPGDGQLRYRLLETIRSYACERLDDRDFERTNELMLRWATDLADEIEDEIDGPGEEEAFARASIEQENLTTAIGHAETAGDAVSAMTIAAVLAVWLDVVGQFGEGIALCEDVLAWTSDVDPTSRRRLLLRAGNLALSSGRLDRAHHFYEESLALARELVDPQGELSAINNLSITAMWQGNFTLARELLAGTDEFDGIAPASQAILQVTKAELALYSGDLDGVIDALDAIGELQESVGTYTLAEAEMLRGSAQYALGRPHEAGTAFELALAHAEAAEAMEFTALARHGQALVALDEGNVDTARKHLDIALADARAAGHNRAIATLLCSMGRLEQAAGDVESARRRQREALGLRVTMGDRYGVAQSLEAEASLYALEGDVTDAVRMHGAAAALREQTGGPRWPVELTRVDAELDQLRSALGDDFDAGWAEGAAAVAPDRPLADAVTELAAFSGAAGSAR